MAKGWSAERRQKQAQRCRQNKPWEKSTGPKTTEGKKWSSLNAFKHGGRCRILDESREMLRLNWEFVSSAERVLLDSVTVMELEARRQRQRTERKAGRAKQNQGLKTLHPSKIYKRSERNGKAQK